MLFSAGHSACGPLTDSLTDRRPDEHAPMEAFATTTTTLIGHGSRPDLPPLTQLGLAAV